MRTLEELLRGDLATRIEACLDSEDESFQAVIDTLKLDPKKDLRFCNWRGCDFSGCDMRGWDLTGCDLRDTTGVNVKFDETTRFERSEVDRSIFAYFIRERRFFASHPEAEAEFRRVSKLDWFDKQSWILKQYPDQDTAEATAHIAQRVLRTDTSVALRVSMLYAADAVFPGPSAYGDFLRDVFARSSGEARILEACLRILSLNAFDTPETFQLLTDALSGSEFEVTYWSLAALSNSRLFPTKAKAITATLMSDDLALFRKQLVARNAQLLGSPYSHVLRDSSDQFLDFGKPLSSAQVSWMLRMIEALGLQSEGRFVGTRRFVIGDGRGATTRVLESILNSFEYYTRAPLRFTKAARQDHTARNPISFVYAELKDPRSQRLLKLPLAIANVINLDPQRYIPGIE